MSDHITLNKHDSEQHDTKMNFKDKKVYFSLIQTNIFNNFLNLHLIIFSLYVQLFLNMFLNIFKLIFIKTYT